MKTIATINKLASLAEARACYNGEIGSARVVRNGTVVYGTTFVKGSNSEQAELYHYGTRTALVRNDLDGGGWYLVEVYGESVSDADSVSTFLSHFNISRQFTYRPVNGGFMEVN